GIMTARGRTFQLRCTESLHLNTLGGRSELRQRPDHAAFEGPRSIRMLPVRLLSDQQFRFGPAIPDHAQCLELSASAENRGNSCQRKQHPAEILARGPSLILARGPSCASHRRSSNANSLCGPQFGWITGNLSDLSKGYFATTSPATTLRSS